MAVALAVFGVAAAASGSGSLVNSRARSRREAGYQRTLSAYSQALPPGVTRRYAEDYLRARGAQFQQVGGLGLDTKTARADIVQIGAESMPWYVWYCGNGYVNIALTFTAADVPRKIFDARDSDVLKAVSIVRYEDCL
jgi:hypothetical protein